MNYTVINSGITKENIGRYGLNVLKNIEPIIEDKDGHRVFVMWNHDQSFITTDELYQHVDICGRYPVTITFDMKQPIEIDTAVIGGYYTDNHDYCLSEYELYCSDNITDLYNEENRICRYNNEGVWQPRKADAITMQYSDQPMTGAIQAFEFNTAPVGRFFGVKLLTGCPMDDIARVARVEVHSKKYSVQHESLIKYGKNIIGGKKPVAVKHGDDLKNNIWPIYGGWEYVTDGIAADDKARIKMLPNGKAVYFIYELEQDNKPEHFVISGPKADMPQFELYFGTDFENIFKNTPESLAVHTEDVINDCVICSADLKEYTDVKYVGIKLVESEAGKGFCVDQLAVTGSLRVIRVDTQKVVNEDFMGNGANLVPFTTQPGNIAAGYNDAYWAADEKRIRNMRPQVVRVWAQVDWVEKQKGVFNFDTPEMEGFFKYMDVLQDIDCEVMVTYNWKVGESIQEWFSLPDVSDKRCSAPRDLVQFANSCSVFLQEMKRRGYTKVRHISFANEPGFFWDFLCSPDVDPKAYYVEMVKEVDKKLKQDGVRDQFMIWGPESAEDISWMRYCAERLQGVIDMYTFHCYQHRADEISQILDEMREMGAMPFMITEFAEHPVCADTWGRSYAGYMINGANNGFSGLVVWSLCGVQSMSVYSPNSWKMDGEAHLWSPQLSGGTVKMPYYIMSLISGYIPNHSKVVTVINNNDDIRAAAFKVGENDYTVVVECKTDIEGRSVRLKLGEEVKGKFYKHLYAPFRDTVCEDNAIIPSVVKEFECNGEFVDKDILPGYSVIIYTTLKPLAQVAINPYRTQLSAGESVSLEATVIDCEQKAVNWSVAAGGGTITPNGVYTAANDAVSGDCIAVKAEIEGNGAYGIALINIK